MPTSYTSLLGLALPVTGELSGTWGDTVNQYITQYVDAAVAGAQTISGSQTAVTLSVTNGSALSQAGSGATGSAQYQIINCTGNPASALTVTVPSASKVYLVLNNTSTNQTVTVKGAATTGVTVAAARSALIAWNGTDFELVATDDASKMNGVLAAVNGGTGQSSYAVGDILYASTTTALSKLADVATGNALISGGVGVAPSYGKIGLTTHVSGTLPVANGGTNGTATPTAGTIAYGTGSAYAFNTAGSSGQPLLSGGAGAPTFGTLGVAAGGTGLTSGTSGGVLAFTATGTLASSAALAANALVVGGGAGAAPSTITTGTGVATALGVNTGSAGAFVVNGGALGTPSSGTVTNLTGTASININGTVGATTPNTGAFTSVTSTSASGVLTRAAATQDGVAIVGRAGGTGSFTSTITPTTLTASRTLTAPDNSGTILTTGATVTVAQGGTGATTLTGVVKGNGTSAFTAGTVSLTSEVAGTLPVANGGTGQTTYTDGQLLIGNTATTGLSKATLTAGSGVSITNGNGTITIAATGSGGTVTGVTATSPVASSGGTAPVISLNSAYGDTLNPYGSKTANFFLAAPNGAAGAPTFRAIVAADIPTLNQNTTGTASNVTGTVAIANGGTGQTSAQAAINALAGAVTSGQYLRGNGTNVVMSAIQAADVPTLNQNTTGTASNVTGTVAVANGGTGSTTAAGARTNLGATTVGGNLFTLTNPSAVTFPRFNADNTVSALDAATFRSAIGAGTGSGTVTSVGGTGSVNGITLSGTVTSTGNLTLGGTLSGVSLTTQVSGTLPVANGGTGASDAATARSNLSVPSATGSGASGTWGINISGNAATATSATSAGSLSTTNFTVTQSGSNLVISYNGTAVLSISSTGALTALNNVTAYGTP